MAFLFINDKQQQKMANKQKGYIDIKVGGKKRTLHFSMNFWSEFTEQMGISLQDIGNVFQNGISLKGLRALIYSAILEKEQENIKTWGTKCNDGNFGPIFGPTDVGGCWTHRRRRLVL